MPKVENNIVLMVNGEVKVRSLLLWLFSTHICLLADNVHYVLLFFDNACCIVVFSLGAFLVVWLCLYGFFFVNVVQNSRGGEKDKRRSC